MGEQLTKQESDSQSPENATIKLRKNLNDCVSIFQITPDAPLTAPFVPGQFVELGLPAPVNPNSPRARRTGNRPRLTRRAYSIASTPDALDCIELLLVQIDDGKLTPKLWDLQTGDRVWMSETAKGKFMLSPDDGNPDRDMLWIATGTGIAPFVSMLRSYAASPLWRRLTILPIARDQSCLAYHDELTELAAKHDWLTYLPTLTREPNASDWSGQRGRVQLLLEDTSFESLSNVALSPESTQVWLCGNPDMIGDVTEILKRKSFVPDADIVSERYW